MRSELENIEEIEKYLNEELSSPEKIAFEKRMEADAGLKQQVQLQRLLVAGIEQSGWRAELNAIHARKYSDSDIAGLGWRGLLLLVLLASSVIIFLFYHSPINSASVMVGQDSVRNMNGQRIVGVKTDSIFGSDSSVVINENSPVLLNMNNPELQNSSEYNQHENIVQERREVVHYYPTYREESPSPGKLYRSYSIRKFIPQKEQRMIALPVTSLDYDFHFLKEADRLMDYKLNALIETDKYEKTYIATIQFRYRIEGCLMYAEKADLLDVYTKNISRQLWQVDSMVAQIVLERAKNSCGEQRIFWLKGYEYFSFLASQRYGEIWFTPCVQRNYRKGQIYKVVAEEREVRYFTSDYCGLSKEEAEGLFTYFKNMYVFRDRFREAIKTEKSLEYYYRDAGVAETVILPECQK